MNIIITILLVVAGIIVLLLLFALFMTRKHYVKREIIIHAPRQKVFDYLKLLKNQDEFNKHAMVAPDRERHLKEQTEQLDISMPGKAIKMPVKGKRKLRTSLKGKGSNQKFAL